MVLILVAELIILFFLSRILTSELSIFFQRIFRSRKVSVIFMAIIFLPGTIVHEFSHAIMAKALFVHVGKMELIPELSGDSIKLGSVEVGKTDVIRNFFIGIAPFVAGTTILLTMLFYSFANNILGFNLFTFLILLFTFIISNTMYSSKKDMEGAVEFFLLVVVPIFFIYYVGFRIPGLNEQFLKEQGIDVFLQKSAVFLGVPILLDTALILFGKIVNKR